MFRGVAAWNTSPGALCILLQINRDKEKLVNIILVKKGRHCMNANRHAVHEYPKPWTWNR